jgi:hypothetical protein
LTVAEALIRTYSLPVLRIRLDELAVPPVAIFELILAAKGKEWPRDQRACPLADLGFGDVPAPTVPQWVADWLGKEVEPSLFAESESSRVLWLHLAKPYGLLGAVPWERHIQPAVDVPVLRLPDVLPDIEQESPTFDIALCVLASDEDQAELARDVADAMLRGVGQRLRLHVFCDARAHEQLYPKLRNRLPGRPVEFYRFEPEVAKPRPMSGPPQNPWLTWIRRTMQHRGLEAVHFLAHGAALGTEGAMLLPSLPIKASAPQLVQAGELRTFLTQVGALNVGFTALPDNPSPFGLLRLVDELGALRAGPVALHDTATDPHLTALKETYSLLAAQGPAEPPAHPSLVLFAQPRQIAGVTAEQPRVKRVSPVDIGHAIRAVQDRFVSDDTPQWVAAAARYIEAHEAELTRFREGLESQPATAAQIAHFDGVATALSRIRAVVDKYSEEPR